VCLSVVKKVGSVAAGPANWTHVHLCGEGFVQLFIEDVCCFTITVRFSRV